jgi:hypothetical protein
MLQGVVAPEINVACLKTKASLKDQLVQSSLYGMKRIINRNNRQTVEEE